MQMVLLHHCLLPSAGNVIAAKCGAAELLFYATCRAMIQKHPEKAGSPAGPTAMPAAEFNDSAHGGQGHISSLFTTEESSDDVEKPLEKPIPLHQSYAAGQHAVHDSSDILTASLQATTCQ